MCPVAKPAVAGLPSMRLSRLRPLQAAMVVSETSHRLVPTESPHRETTTSTTRASTTAGRGTLRTRLRARQAPSPSRSRRPRPRVRDPRGGENTTSNGQRSQLQSTQPGQPGQPGTTVTPTWTALRASCSLLYPSAVPVSYHNSALCK